MAQNVDRENFTGRVVLSVNLEVMDLDVDIVTANLEALLRDRLDQWPNEVVDYSITSELFGS